MLTLFLTGLHCIDQTFILRAEMHMRRLLTLAGLLTALSFGGGSALAFQETSVPPPEPAAKNAPRVTPPPMKLGSPADGPVTPEEESKGIKLFGYTILPKLNFGLDLLYSKEEEKSQLQQGSALEEDSDVSVVGKLKRRF
jgi:hypothetical protein